MLVSQGARTFATSNGVPTCDLAALVAPRCISEWEHWKKILVDLPPSTPQKYLDVETPMQDTVGAISWDSNGKLAAGVSRSAFSLARSCTHLVGSGGLLLKYPGRIGEVRNCTFIPNGPLTHTRLQYLVLGVGHSRIPKSVSLAVYQVWYIPPGLLRSCFDGSQELGNRLYVLQ